jgi:hypothetical protein
MELGMRNEGCRRISIEGKRMPLRIHVPKTNTGGGQWRDGWSKSLK